MVIVDGGMLIREEKRKGKWWMGVTAKVHILSTNHAALRRLQTRGASLY